MYKNWVKYFELQSQKYFDKIIVRYDGNNTHSTLSYKTLNQRSNQLAYYLLKHGFMKQHTVASLFNRYDTNALIVFIALMKIGCRGFILEPILHKAILLSKIKEVDTHCIITTHQCKNKVLDDVDNYSFLYYDDIELELETYPIENLNIQLLSTDIAFILVSSGTTGKPKIMKLPHSFIMDMCNSYQLLGTQLIQIARKNFDACIYEYLIAFSNNMCLHLIDETTITDPYQFQKFFSQQTNNEMFSFIITPSHIRYIVDTMGKENASTLFEKYVDSIQLVGEGFNLSLAAYLYDLGAKRIINAYGPSEAGISVSSAILFDRISNIAEKFVHIGTPIQNTDIHILTKKNDKWVKCQTDEKGFLCVRNSIHNVYLNPDLNAQKYFQYNGHILFNTNDIAYITGTGHIVISGRIDNQLKISGQLVVTTEIENVLTKVANEIDPKRNNCFFIEVTCDNTLRAYHISTDEDDAAQFIKQLRFKLIEYLEIYKIPKEYYWISAFPQKLGSKLDILEIKQNAKLTPLIVENIAKTHTEKVVVKQFATIVKIPIQTVDVCMTFEYMGCSSLLFMGFIANCQTLFPNIVLNITAIKDIVNIRTLSKYIDEKPIIQLPDPHVLCKFIQKGCSAYPIFCAPPGDGLPLVYNKLSSLLGKEWTVYGFRIPGSNKGEKIIYYSVEDYATIFINILISIQPNGPITLLGYCAGGTLIIEMAQQLKQKYQREIAFIGMIDAPNPQQTLDFGSEEVAIKTTFSGLFQIEIEDGFTTETSEQLIDHLIDIGIAQHKLPPNQDRDFFKRFIKMEEITRDSIANYAPVFYPNPVTYFKAEVSNNMPWMPHPHEKWTPFIPKINIVQCQGSHLSMMKDVNDCLYLATQILTQLSEL